MTSLTPLTDDRVPAQADPAPLTGDLVLLPGSQADSAGAGQTIHVDLHIHSALSPCSDNDMTPGNIVGMAMIIGLDAIAITDHQSCGNCEAAMAIAEAMAGPVVLPGLEIESAEEIHLVCLLPDLAAARTVEAMVRAAMPFRANRIDIFGEQILFNDDDEPVGQEERLLLIACSLTSDEIARTVLDLGGVCLPAHIDRDANSLLATLGAIPEEFPLTWFELSRHAVPAAFFREHPELANLPWLSNSDAHHLIDIAEPGWPLRVTPWRDPAEGRRHILQTLRQGRASDTIS